MRSNALDEGLAVLVRYCFLVLLDCDLHERLPLGLEAVGIKALCGIKVQLFGFRGGTSSAARNAPEICPSRILDERLTVSGVRRAKRRKSRKSNCALNRDEL